MAQANREIWRMLRDGVKVSVRDEDDEEIEETVRVIDWDDPTRTTFSSSSSSGSPVNSTSADPISSAS
jgi:type I restriction enzyme, R subunit